MCLIEWLLVFTVLTALDTIIWPTCSSTLQVRAILYIVTLTTGIMEAVTNVDHAVAEALSTRHHSPANSTTRSARKLRVQAAILMPVREALKTLHESQDCTWKGLSLSLMPSSCSVCLTAPPHTSHHTHPSMQSCIHVVMLSTETMCLDVLEIWAGTCLFCSRLLSC